MNNIEDRILRFGELSAEARHDVEAYVRAHPQWTPLLDDVKALYALREELQFLHGRDEVALAYYVVAKAYKYPPSSVALQQVFDRLRMRIEEEPAFRERYEALMQRAEALAADFDPVRRFEQLSGIQVRELPDAEKPETSAARAASSDARPARPSARQWKARLERFLTLPQAVQWAVAAMGVVVVGYAALFAVSLAMQSKVEQLALVDVNTTEIEGYQPSTRGASETTDSLSNDALYLQALSTLRAAHTTTLGLFPRYDAQKLAKAEQMLRHVIQREAPRSFLQLEGYFFLGKVHLAQGEIEAARRDFKAVVLGEGRRAAEAVDILTRLQRLHPARPDSIEARFSL